MFFINLSNISRERFDLSKFMEFTDDFDPITSFFLAELRELPSKGQYTVRTELARPDLVAFRFYRSTQYWWIVLLYNGMITPDDLTAGTVLSIPAESDLSNLFFRLKGLQQAEGQ